MSKRNLNIVKTFFEAVSKGDKDTARNVLDDEIEWTEPDVPGLWFSGTHRGAEAAMSEVVKPTYEIVDDFSVRTDEFLDAGEETVVLGRFSGRIKDSGKNFEIPACFVCRVQNKKIIRFRAYHNTALWLEAVGEYVREKAA